MASSSSSDNYSESSSSSSIDSSSSSSIDSSSSSSSSVSSSSSSSSSSSMDITTLDTRLALINQGQGDIIPFTFIVEKGPSVDLGDGSEIRFTIESASSSAFKYQNIIDVTGNKEDI